MKRRLLILLALAIALIMRFTHIGAPDQSDKSLPAVSISTADLYPDLHLTPGETDPRVTQANINTTICKHGYTETVRPPLEWSNRLKHEVMQSYKVSGGVHDYELDHLIPLELGGCPACITNLWPEPIAAPGAHEKDAVELYLHERVCAGALSLSDAQKAITKDWYAIYQALPRKQAPVTY